MRQVLLLKKLQSPRTPVKKEAESRYRKICQGLRLSMIFQMKKKCAAVVRN
jgi:hypothetical protein